MPNPVKGYSVSLLTRSLAIGGATSFTFQCFLINLKISVTLNQMHWAFCHNASCKWPDLAYKEAKTSKAFTSAHRYSMRQMKPTVRCHYGKTESSDQSTSRS